MGKRKQHSSEAGYAAERMNPHYPGAKVVTYLSAEQDIEARDTDGLPRKYAVVCDAHSMIGGAASVPKARFLMKNPEHFCLDCRALTERDY